MSPRISKIANVAALTYIYLFFWGWANCSLAVGGTDDYLYARVATNNHNSHISQDLLLQNSSITKERLPLRLRVGLSEKSTFLWRFQYLCCEFEQEWQEQLTTHL
jgi:hypothetical protein